MVSLNISGVPEEEAKRWSQLAEDSPAKSRSEWLRHRLRAGSLVMNAHDSLDVETLDALSDDDDVLLDIDDSGDPAPAHAPVANSIADALSAGEPMDLGDLREHVVEDLVADALTDLKNEGRIDYVPMEGYVANE